MSNPTPSLILEIKAEMVRRQTDYQSLATATGMSESQLSRRLSGAVSLTVADAMVITEALGLPLWKVMQRAAESTHVSAA